MNRRTAIKGIVGAPLIGPLLSGTAEASAPAVEQKPKPDVKTITIPADYRHADIVFFSTDELMGLLAQALFEYGPYWFADVHSGPSVSDYSRIQRILMQFQDALKNRNFGYYMHMAKDRASHEFKDTLMELFKECSAMPNSFRGFPDERLPGALAVKIAFSMASELAIRCHLDNPISREGV